MRRQQEVACKGAHCGALGVCDGARCRVMAHDSVRHPPQEGPAAAGQQRDSRRETSQST